MDLFKRATKEKFRFISTKIGGVINTEDLWDLSLEILDDIACILKKKIDNENVESFIPNKNKKKNNDQLKLDVIVQIINDKVNEEERVKVRAANKIKNQRIMELIYGMENDELKSKSIDELKNMLVNDDE